MSNLLPVWIIGAPLLYAIFDWLRTPKGSVSQVVYPDTFRAPLTTSATLR